MYEIKMDMTQTIGLAVVVLIIGRILRRNVKFFEVYCIPSPVIGGFLFAIINLLVNKLNLINFTFDVTLQKFFMTVFFTSVGFNASWRLLRVGGKKVGIFLMVAVGLVLLQNIVAVTVGKLLGINPLLALLTGSTSMTGGHGTAAAMAPLIESMGLTNAKNIAITAATFGLIAGSSMGGPIANSIIKKKRLEIKPVEVAEDNVKNDELLFSNNIKELDGEKFAKAFFLILLSMFIGSYVSTFLNNFFTFPSYIGSMLVAAVIRNISDFKTGFDIHYDEVRVLEDVSLNLFLSMAMMTLKLWQLTEVALPLLVLLLAQCLLIYVYVRFVTFKVMGSNYDAAVLSAGHVGFGLGATPNGIANMQSISQRYAYSSLAFFVLPIIGSLFIDFFNVAIISSFITWLS